MQIPTCANCDEGIRETGDADICDEEHEELDEPVLIHADCPCPVHGWDGDRTDYGGADAA